MSGGDPYCAHCDYDLRGLTESSRCPECGRPFVEVLQRRGQLLGGKRYTSATRIFGLPLIQVAYGPHGSQRSGSARAIIAMGDRAMGVLAIGGFAMGLFAVGGMGVGGFAIGGLACGIFTFAGVSLAIWALAGLAIGALASGGVALGWIVPSAGLGVAYFGRGGLIYGVHVMDSRGGSSEEAQVFFREMAWLLGSQPNTALIYLWPLMAALISASLVLLIIVAGYLATRRHASAG